MASESEGESDAQFTECQTPGCKKRGLKEEVLFLTFANEKILFYLVFWPREIFLFSIMYRQIQVRKSSCLITSN